MRNLLVAVLVLSALSARAQEADDDASVTEDAEAESQDADVLPPAIRYTSDLTDEELQKRWQEDPAKLGSISVGFADQGRLLNAVRMPDDPAWICQRPDLAWGTQEAVDSLISAFHAVHYRFPDSVPARLSHIGAKDGGYLRPHRSHQSGRDADIGFFYRKDQVPGGRGKREKLIDLPRTWTLLRSLIMLSDVQMVLVDRGVQKALRDYALASGEDKAWVGRIFRPGTHALVQHAKKHRDHLHVRFFAPRSQELGRRIQPLLAQRPETNLVMHKVKRGQTLGHVAKAYGTTVASLRKANHLRSSFLHLDQRLVVPLRGACTHCPLPPPVVVPPRCLPGEDEPKLAISSLMAPVEAPLAARPAGTELAALRP